ncbi:carbon-nitrogen hydrolase family protein [uncultured Phascolarctobacterium sp.]|uniref:carbon-nitrogen hydrolase family protein n=1 Tax=uncultured Phascolarctobacterium sp. TaxID=512296 RepID=UPI0025CD5EF3|nr:carbon-nitrogen hydrolase family protein [uncultured Phascolarctobacterium sp.]
MKIAFLHLSYCGLPQSVNQEKLLYGMQLASKYNVQWVLTPEMALQGYHMIREDYLWQFASTNNGVLQPFIETARRYEQRLFLGCAYMSDRQPHNSCVIIDAKGCVCHCHHKVKVVQWTTERWAEPGNVFAVWDLDGIKTSVMVCADLYFAEHGKNIAKQGAELVVGSVAWPEGNHGGKPRDAWRRLSAASGGIPVLVANQTGSLRMDFTKAESAVIVNGEVLCAYSGAEAILILEFDEQKKSIVSKEFMVVPYGKR